MKEYGYLINLKCSLKLKKGIKKEYIAFLKLTLKSEKFHFFDRSSKVASAFQIIRDLTLSNEELLLLRNSLPNDVTLDYSIEKVYKSSEEFKEYVYVCSECDNDFFILKKNEKCEEELICICGNKKFNPMLRDIFFKRI